MTEPQTILAAPMQRDSASCNYSRVTHHGSNRFGAATVPGRLCPTSLVYGSLRPSMPRPIALI